MSYYISQRNSKSKPIILMENNIIEFLKPIKFMARFFGCLAFDFPKSMKSNEIKYTCFNRMSVIRTIFLFGFSFYFHLYTNVHDIQSKSLIISKGSKFLCLYGCANGLFSILSDVKNARKIWKIIQIYHHFDEEVQT